MTLTNQTGLILLNMICLSSNVKCFYSIFQSFPDCLFQILYSFHYRTNIHPQAHKFSYFSFRLGLLSSYTQYKMIEATNFTYLIDSFQNFSFKTQFPLCYSQFITVRMNIHFVY
jgi:hypothetical protein